MLQMFEDFVAIAKIATDQILLLINQINKRLQMTFQSQVISCYKCSNGIICNISFEYFVAFTKNATDQPLLLINRISKRFQVTFQSQVILCYKSSNGLVHNIFKDFIAKIAMNQILNVITNTKHNIFNKLNVEWAIWDKKSQPHHNCSIFKIYLLHWEPLLHFITYQTKKSEM